LEGLRAGAGEFAKAFGLRSIAKLNGTQACTTAILFVHFSTHFRKNQFSSNHH